jgi:NAD(P)-dependent dehydrogenase (short-subunit alcohol dehydrogenase family)
MAGYSALKAAAHSLTQALRPVLAAQGICAKKLGITLWCVRPR